MAVIVENLTLSGAKEQGAPGSGGGVMPPKGNYEVRITDTKAHSSADGKASVLVQVAFTGDYEGAECRIYLGTDFSVQGNRNSWFTALKSVGLDDSVIAQLADGRSFNVDTGEYLDNRTAYIYFEPRDKEAGKQYDEKKFITKDAYLNGGTKAAPTAPKVSVSVSAPKGASAAPSISAGVPKPATSSNALNSFMAGSR
jgi:hypothetical protein